jgi:hypothetical protein
MKMLVLEWFLQTIVQLVNAQKDIKAFYEQIVKLIIVEQEIINEQNALIQFGMLLE